MVGKNIRGFSEQTELSAHIADLENDVDKKTDVFLPPFLLYAYFFLVTKNIDCIIVQQPYYTEPSKCIKYTEGPIEES